MTTSPLTFDRDPHIAAAPPMAAVPFEVALSQNYEWAMSEASEFLDGRGRVQETLRQITARLNQLGIPYGIAGGLALFTHGFRRFTEDVDILVTRTSLHKLHAALDGRGYVRPFEMSKNLRDTTTGVRIDFLIAGEFPGDGKPKPLAFPDPLAASETLHGMSVLRLPRLIELKLASGMTGAGRGKDLGDVEELIKILHLPEQTASQLHPSVQPKFLELWRSIHAAPTRFIRTLPAQLAAGSPEASLLAAMQADGIAAELRGNPAKPYWKLTTADPVLAQKYGMFDETEFFEEDSSGEPFN